ncbi:MAG: c(7)-type cytochrome triheme domain-containing protein [Porticoccus sp.]
MKIAPVKVQSVKSFIMKFAKAITITATLVSVSVFGADLKAGKKTVETYCAGCHSMGVMGAPKIGNQEDWSPRAERGRDTLIVNAIKGFKGMPAKGGNPALSDQDIENAVAYLLNVAKIDVAKKPAVKKAPVTPQAKKTPAKPPAIKSVAKKKASSVNSFNRLMKSRSEWNPPPSEDGIHDPENDATYTLQQPKDAFEGLPSNNFGNRVDWVKALETGDIQPRYDRLDPTKKPFVMDLNIVREVKGSMPDVVYPHKQHTEWLDCSNCHPAIFIPKKGANPISMASILMGEKCGVCHGKIAFPVSECRRCHSKKKTAARP